ncbi:Lysine histidine transporter 2 [Sesamum angolense]|uniref:Lysine histidine transporter 2 n=1 Tax=Sesamum angolense TaxID=2727404 RepID=A0AAE2BS86_9LAMI|nr:Lysine histidine transporter 2 [Sesamum angolense]
MVLSWIITLYTLWQMVEMHEAVPGKRFDRYHELGQHAFGEKLGLWLVVPQQLMVEVGVNIVYMVTGGKSLKKIHDILRPDQPMRLSYFTVIFGSVHFFLSHLPNFNSITVISLAAALMSISYSTIAWAASLHKGISPEVVYLPRASTSTGRVFEFLSALGDVAFAFAGHNVVLEIQATIPSTPEKPSKKPMWKGVVIAYIVVALCYFPVAFVGYYIFGTRSRTIFYLAPKTGLAYHCGQHVCRHPCHWQLPALTMVLGVSFPFFGGLLSFFGGFAFAPTSYYLPCIMWLAIHKPKRFSLSWFANWTCIVLGILLMVLAPIGALRQIILQAKGYKFFS